MVCTSWTRFLSHFQNGALHFCIFKTDKVIKQSINFNSIDNDFCKMNLVNKDCYFFGFKPSKPNP